MEYKKLKDLKKGDRVYNYNTYMTTPIYVESVKRVGYMMQIQLRWEDGFSENSLIEACGHALGYTMSGYNRLLRHECLFTTNGEVSKNNERENRMKNNYIEVATAINTLKKFFL